MTIFEKEKIYEFIRFTGDWRIFKKKKNIIFPILILLNLIKLKLLLLPIFLGVHFIKKLLVLGSLILPSVFAHLKICKVQHPHAHHAHPFHLWSTAADTTADYPTGKSILKLFFVFDKSTMFSKQVIYQIIDIYLLYLVKF